MAIALPARLRRSGPTAAPRAFALVRLGRQRFYGNREFHRERTLTNQMLAVRPAPHSRECLCCGLPYSGTRTCCDQCMEIAARVATKQLPAEALYRELMARRL
jgi:hypothetical protein